MSRHRSAADARPPSPLACGGHGPLALLRPGRTMAKTLSFALLHFLVGFLVSYAFTGSVAIAGGIALVEPLANTVVFYFHERAWSRKAARDAPSAERRGARLGTGCPEPA
jgi:uncharacterized membrane protein